MPSPVLLKFSMKDDVATTGVVMKSLTEGSYVVKMKVSDELRLSCF